MTQPPRRDGIYAIPQDTIAGFRFDADVAAVFPDMISRSVPGYDLTLPLIGLLAARYAQPGTHIYDLGCSLGAATLTMQALVPHKDVVIKAVDNSSAMLAKLEGLLKPQPDKARIELIEAGIESLALIDASVVVLNFTLQFVSPAQRELLLARIQHALRPGGILILSEKVIFADQGQNERFIALHHAFKRLNGYSELEVSQKRTALENVLVPETQDAHEARLQRVGFAPVEQVFQALNFVAWVAHKPDHHV